MQAAACVRPGWWAALLVMAGLVPCGCADTASIVGLGHVTHDVERMGHGVYNVHTHIIGLSSSVGDAKADNLRAAAAYCAKKGLAMTAIGDTGYGGLASDHTLAFRCGVPATGKHQADSVPGNK